MDATLPIADSRATALTLSDAELHRIVDRATTLYERIQQSRAGVCELPADRQNHKEIERRLETWKHFAAAGDAATFARRLAWDGLDLAAARWIVSPSLTIVAELLPSWAHTLRDLLTCSSQLRPEGAQAERFMCADDPVPFEEIFESWVVHARARLQRAAGDRYQQLSAEAQATAERTLLRMISAQAGQALQFEFSLYRARQRTSLERLLSRLQTAAERDLYRSFVTDTVRDGLVEFLTMYSFLARQCATVVELWIADHAEFLERLEADRDALGDSFGDGRDPGIVASLATGLSDRHCGGRTVFRVRLASGLEVIYKPKDLRLDNVFAHFIEWLNWRNPRLPLRTPVTLERPGYGWVEAVTSKPCQDATAARDFYGRTGTLICVVYLLGGNDAHEGNLIASGEDPMLIDVETLMHPGPLKGDDEQRRSGAAALFVDSVLSTGFLPQWVTGPDGGSFDVSGLAGAGGQSTNFTSVAWRDINTDRMEIELARGSTEGGEHIPRLAGHLLEAADYLDDVTGGFAETYRCLLANREALLAPDGPLASFSSILVRMIARPTKLYGRLLKQTLSPEWRREGILAGIAWDVLSRAFTGFDEKPASFRALEAEHRSLSELDIPLFHASTTGTDLLESHGLRMRACLATTSFDRCLARVQRLDEVDLALQLDLIRASFRARSARHEISFNSTANAVDGSSIAMPDAANFLQAARKIGDAIVSRAVRSGDGSASWIGLELDPAIDRFRLRPLGPSLFSGAPGVALFLAALAARTGEEVYSEIGRAALNGVVWELRQGGFKAEGRELFGGITGISSVAYSLLRSGRLLDDTSLVDAAIEVLERVGSQLGDDCHVLSGTAGSLLVSLAVYEETGNPWALNLATAFGRRLSAERLELPAGGAAWPNQNGTDQTGFSHGAAGISCALARLFRVSGTAEFREAAQAGIAFEQGVLRPGPSNSPDLPGVTHPNGPSLMASWCQGASGIGLARLASLDVIDTPEIRDEIEQTFDATLACGSSDLDTLCCGNSGRADSLLEAGLTLGRPELIDAARRLMVGVVQRAREVKDYRLIGDSSPGIVSPGFFQGLAGIGYGLLRLSDGGEALPCVLRLA